MRLLEAWLYDAALTANRSVELTLATTELPQRLELGRAGRLTRLDSDGNLQCGIRAGDNEIVIRTGEAGTTRSLVLNQGVRLTFPAQWKYEPPFGLRHGETYLHVPIYDAGLCNPHAGASAPVVRVADAVAGWVPTLTGASRLFCGSRRRTAR